MWLYIPSYQHSQESGGLTLELETLSELERSLTLRGKHRAPAFWRRELRKDCWTWLRSFLQLSNSRQKSLLEKQMDSLADSPVSLGRFRVRAKGNLTKKGETYGPRRSDSFAQYSPDGSSWKTSQISLLTNTSAEFLEIWPKAASISSMKASPPRRRAHRTGASVFSFLPSIHRLDNQAGKQWPTMTAGDHYNPNHKDDHDVKRGLLRGVVTNWPTPAARDFRGLDSPGKQNYHKPPRMYFTASGNSRPAQTTQHGGMFSETIQNSPRQPVNTNHQHDHKCLRLNPRVVEWMMLGKSKIGWLL